MSDLTIRRVPELTVPTIHLNGSDHNHLIDGYARAASILRDAREALQATAPHGRDYYVQQNPDALKSAQAEHTLRIVALDHIINELQTLIMAIDEQLDL